MMHTEKDCHVKVGDKVGLWFAKGSPKLCSPDRTGIVKEVKAVSLPYEKWFVTLEGGGEYYSQIMKKIK